jgi:glucan 1,3-beta-glucosidase
MTSTSKLRDNIKKGVIQVRGVNLGGWLVAEEWMTWQNELWKGVPRDVFSKGEFATTKYLGKTRAWPLIKGLRDTFITQQDIADIAKAKLNVVRVPVGHWSMGYDNNGGVLANDWALYAPNSILYLDKLIHEWAPKYNICVLVSIHAARGSQNGFDHSSPSQTNGVWSNATENVNNTLDFVSFLVKRYKDNDAFLGIGLLNEPANGASKHVLKDYYERAYKLVRCDNACDCILTFSPLIWEQNSKSDWNTFFPKPDYFNVWHEWHRYHVWGFEQATLQDIVQYTENDLLSDCKAWNGQPVIVGEWSMALCDNVTEEKIELFKRYAKNQLEAFTNCKAGWFFWNWKVHGDGDNNGWSLRDMINKNIICL